MILEGAFEGTERYFEEQRDPMLKLKRVVGEQVDWSKMEEALGPMREKLAALALDEEEEA